MTSPEIIEIQVNCPDVKSADEIAKSCLESKLIACSNISGEISGEISGKIRSAYFWQGKVEQEDEVLLVMKTRSVLFEAVSQTVNKLHPYEVPCIIGIEIDRVNEDYRDWVFSVTQVTEF